MISGQKERFYRFDGFIVDPSRRSLRKSDEFISLTPKAFDLLVALLEKPGEVITKNELLERVWQGQIVEEGNLTVHIASIRKALGETKGGHRFVATVPGRGYQFVADVVTEDHGFIIEEHSLSRIAIEPDGDGVEQIKEPFPEIHVSGKRLSRSIVTIAGVLILAFIVAFLIYRFGRRTVFQSNLAQPTSRQLTVSGNVSSSALSPDGKFFAYRQFEKGKFSLWCGNTSGGNSIQLQPPGDVDYEGLTFTPDGSSILYVDRDNLVKIPTLGGPAQTVADHVPGRFSISPDGKQIAFVRRVPVANTSSIVIRTFDDGEREVLKLRGSNAFSDFPAWSPDGTRLAIGVENETQPHTYILNDVDITGGQMRVLNTRAWESINKAVWLNDGKSIAFNAIDSQSDYHIWMLDYLSGELRSITNDLSRYGRETVSVSEDGNELLAVRSDINSSIWTGAASDISQLQRVTTRSSGKLDGAAGLSWMPNGKIVYSSFFDNGSSLWTMNSNGSEAKQLTSSGFKDKNPVATRDGRFIVFQSNRSGGQDIWRVNADGSDLKQLTTNGMSGLPDVTPNGHWVVYAEGADGTSFISRISIDGGPSTRVIKSPSDFPKVSPDGHYLACAYSERNLLFKYQIGIFPFEGGEPLYKFDRPPGATFNNGFHWSADGSAIIIRDFTSGLWRQPVAGGPPEKMKDVPNERIYFFDWSRDGESFAVSYGSESRDVVLISNIQ